MTSEAKGQLSSQMIHCKKNMPVTHKDAHHIMMEGLNAVPSLQSTQRCTQELAVKYTDLAYLHVCVCVYFFCLKLKSHTLHMYMKLK